MSYDYKPQGDEKPNPITRKAWDAMLDSDRINFSKLGGAVYDEPDPEDLAKAAEVITSLTGETTTRGEWDRMSNGERVAFVRGEQTGE